MSKFGISVVIPSIGRPHLATVLDTLGPQLGTDDEVVVVSDYLHNPTLVGQMVGMRNQMRYISGPRPDATHFSSWMGCREIDAGIDQARGSWLWIVADDDLPAHNALERIRHHLVTDLGNYNKPHGFAVIDRFHKLRHFGTLDQNKVCAPNIVWPLHLGKDRMPKCWDGKREYWTDWRFNLRGVAEFGAPVWHDEVVYYVERMK